MFRSVLGDASSADHQKVVKEASAFVQDSQDKIDNDEGYPDWSVDEYQSLLRQAEQRSRTYEQSLNDLSEQMKAESHRQQAKKQFETAFDGLKTALDEACKDCSETRYFNAASKFVENVQDAVDNDESYPDWPVKEYLSLQDKVQQQTEDFKHWWKQYLDGKRSQRTNHKDSNG